MLSDKMNHPSDLSDEAFVVSEDDPTEEIFRGDKDDLSDIKNQLEDIGENHFEMWRYLTSVRAE